MTKQEAEAKGWTISENEWPESIAYGSITYVQENYDGARWV